MRIQVLVLALCVISGSIIFMLVSNTHEVADFPTRSGPIVAFGDSLTEGIGASVGNSYVDVLSERLGEEIINMGVAGNTTTDGLLRVREVIELTPRLVILALGGNDTLRRMSADHTEQNLRDLIEVLHDEHIAVLLIGITGGFSNGAKYTDMFEGLAAEYGLAYVPNILNGLLGKSEYMSDAIHPNDKGYIKIADKIEPELRMLLEH